MNNEMKRRVFIVATFGTLLGLPFVTRYLTGERRAMPEGTFQLNLERYRRKIAFYRETLDGPDTFDWKLTPVPEKEIQYFVFLESTGKTHEGNWDDLSPDVYYAAEGTMSPILTCENELLIQGQDQYRGEFWPASTQDIPKQEFALWLKNGHLVQVKKRQDKEEQYYDRSFVHLLAMNEIFPRVKLRTTVRKEVGRMFPFKGRVTDYTACGYEMIDQHKTLHFKFKSYPNKSVVSSSSKTSPKQGDADIKNRSEEGDVWFDIETGLLVLQQMEIRIHLDEEDSLAGTREYTARSTVKLS